MKGNSRVRLGLSVLEVGIGVIFALSVSNTEAQINTGSDGHDGALNPTANLVINMADHPDGVYQYTSVSIPSGVTVTFIPNSKNTPVYWLVQGDVTIGGTVDISAPKAQGAEGGSGGPGGWAGGNGGSSWASGQGPGGGTSLAGYWGGGASYGSLGGGNPGAIWGKVPAPGPVYGNSFLVPLLGGSGGGGAPGAWGGGGGGGAILIAAGSMIVLDGTINSSGGVAGWRSTDCTGQSSPGGSGGGVRLVAMRISGRGAISTDGKGGCYVWSGFGRVRFDTYQSDFVGSISGAFTQGTQFVIIPAAGQLPQLTVTSVGGVPVSASPTGVLFTPDAVLSAQQSNPIPVAVKCSNLPLHTLISVTIKPANGSSVSATGYNDAGTIVSSTATVLVNIPRGGGLVYATAATSN